VLCTTAAPPADPPSAGFELRTARLRLREMRAADLPAFVAYRQDPEVARYQGWDESFSLDDSASAKIRRFLSGSPEEVR